MKKLAFWSARNPTHARLIIALCHIIMTSAGILFGIATYLEDIMIPKGLLALFCIVFAIAYILYPTRGRTSGLLTYSWRRRVKHDMVLALSYTFILIVGINSFAIQPIHIPPSPAQVKLMIISDRGITTPKTKKEMRKDFILTIKSYKAEIKQQFKELKLEWKETKEKRKDLLPVKILLGIVVLGFAILAGYGIAALSCELSCSGQEELAVLVLILGAVGIISLLIIAMRAIARMGNIPEPVKSPPT